MKTLVGYTGFVGSNIVLQTKFDALYNSKNISDSYNTNPELLVFSGIRAEKFLANKFPEKDQESIDEAIDNIKKINPKKIILISTIDVYPEPFNVDEDSVIDIEKLQPYGLNRYRLERWIEDNCSDYLIIRLPALYGNNIKKNFIYDLIHFIPAMLSETKFVELQQKDNYLSRYYSQQENGFYKCKELSDSEKDLLKKYFLDIGFSAINFTDSRSTFPFYNLNFLWKHITIALENKIKKINLAVEPISAGELYKYVKKTNFINEVSSTPAHYDFKTKHFKIFNGKNGYIYGKQFVLEDIKKFIENSSDK